jgi:hypothetical protein
MVATPFDRPVAAAARYSKPSRRSSSRCSVSVSSGEPVGATGSSDSGRSTFGNATTVRTLGSRVERPPLFAHRLQVATVERVETAHAPLRSGRCWYCGEKVLREGDPLEHVIPAAIGGTLTTNRVCEA